MGASIGIALYPEDGADASALLKSADAAMYAAKQAGKGTYRFYSRDFEGSLSPGAQEAGEEPAGAAGSAEGLAARA